MTAAPSMVGPYKGIHPTRGKVNASVVGPGESAIATRPPAPWGSQPSDFDVKQAVEMRPEQRLFLYCEVTYTDIFGKHRTSSAAWECDAPPILGENVKWIPIPRYRRMD